MGRKAKPITLHLLEGNKNRLTKEEIEKRKAAEEQLKMKSDSVKPPSWLSTKAKREFKRIAQELMEVDLVTNVDIDVLAAYVDAYCDYIECTEIIRQDGLMIEHTNKAGETNRVPHPLLTKKKQLFDQMKAIAAEFGLTPSARAKLTIPKQEEKELTEADRLFGDV